MVLSELDHTIKHLAKWMKPRKVGTPVLLTGTRSEVRYEAKGVVLIMAPWNYPFQLTLAPLGRKQLRHELSTWARFAEAVGKIVRASEKPAWVQG